MKRKIFTVLAYTLLVTVVLFMSQCEHGVKLTTVKRDARRIIELAQQIESEEELKRVEKLAREYEIGYQRSHNGAVALEFKRLTNDALREASVTCDEIHAENERIAKMQDRFHSSLEELDKAWQHDTSSKEKDLARIKSNNKKIGKIKAAIAGVEREIEDLAMRLIEANYPEDMLAELGALKDKVVAYQGLITEVENDSRIICLAYKLKNIEFEAAVEPKTAAEPEATEVAEEPASEEAEATETEAEASETTEE